MNIPRRVVGAALVGLLLCPTFVMAQNIQNPRTVTFESVDHATITGYELDIVSNAGVVVQTQQIGKGTQDASGVVSASFSVQTIPFGTSYTVRVRAIVTSGTTTLKSVDSTPSPAWDRVPMQPVKVTIK